jgi:hypothetical protein
VAVPDRVCSAASIVSTAATRIPRARRNAQTLGVRARPAPAISTVKDRHLPLAQCRQTLRCSNRLRRHSTARSRSSAANRSQCRDSLRPAACGPAQCELRRVCYAAETVQVVASAAVRLCRRLASPRVASRRLATSREPRADPLRSRALARHARSVQLLALGGPRRPSEPPPRLSHGGLLSHATLVDARARVAATQLGLSVCRDTRPGGVITRPRRRWKWRLDNGPQ